MGRGVIMENMECDIKVVAGGFLVIKPKFSRLDITNASAFKNEILSIIERNREKFLIDLSRVLLIDSKGIGAMVSIYKAMKNKEDLILCGINPVVEEIFKITGVIALFNIVPTEEAFLSLLAAPHKV